MLKVLIAEDELLIADMIEEVLVEHGYDVCGIARTVAEAVALGRMHQPGLAVIDYRLADGGLGTEIVAQLAPLGRIGVLYASGNIADLMASDAIGDACLIKPYRPDDLLRGLEIVAEIVATGTASPPFPGGLRLLPSVATARRPQTPHD